MTDQEITKGLTELFELWKVAQQLKARGLFDETSQAMNWILSNLDTLRLLSNLDTSKGRP
jgi:hypothetical protein